MKSSHYPDQSEIPENELAIRNLAEQLHLGSKETERMPFDAIRYRDTKHKSLAVNPNVPIN